MIQIPFNPKVQKCYSEIGIKLQNISDIVVKTDLIFFTKESCVYYLPEKYMPKNYVFALDLDNTLTYHERSMYIRYTDDIHLLPGRYRILQTIFKMGYTIAVFTNQSNMKVETVIERMKNFLKSVNLPIYVFAALKKDKYRKPEIGMWNLFLEKSKIKPEKVFFCGDALGREFDFADSDKQFGQSIGAKVFTPEEVFGAFNPKSIKKSEKEVVLLFVGAPGTNKSTLYSELYSDYVHVNKDTQKGKDIVIYKNALKEGKNVVVDNTNPTKEIRNTFISLAKPLGYKIVILYFVKAGHNYNDKRVKKVPDVVYHMFFKKLQIPTSDEGEVYLVW